MNTPQTRCPVCGGGLTAAGFCARCVLAGVDPLPPQELPEATPDAHYEPGTAVRYFGHFELLDSGREGGMGVVYHARHVNLKREVALKMILGHCLRSADLVRRFRREVEVLARLDHPNVLPILEVGDQNGQHFYSMKWVAEGSLADQFERWRFSGAGEVKERQRRLVELLMGITCGVQHAHQRGILHRDLKPANVLVDAAGQPYVADFGLAKWAEDEEGGKTQTRAGLGSPAYMSPEQAAGGERELTTATDVWALGVIFYELLTGRRPFVGSSNAEILKRVLEMEPEAPRRVDPRIDRDLETICQKCLEKEPGRRYASAEALGEELERWLRGEPIAARPVTGLERLGKWARRRPVVAGWIGATALALVLGLVGTTWQWQRARSHERQARAHAQEVEAKAAAESELLQRLRLDAANRAFDEDQSHDGVAMLVSLLEDHPTNQAALTRLHSALLYRNWAMPVTPPLRHDDYVNSAQFSPDGTRVVTASTDRTARIWDALTGQAVTEPLRHKDRVRSATFSPDGTWVVTTSEDGTARIWDAQTGQPLSEPLRHEGRIDSAHFSPDGTRVVTASSDATARIWDARTGQALTEPLRHESSVTWAEFSPDGTRVVTASDDHTARIWDARTAQALTEPLRHERRVNSAHFSPDGTRVVTLSSDQTALIWDARAGHVIAQLLGHEHLVNSAQFSPDGTLVVTASSDETARLWDVRTGQALTERLRHEDRVNSAQFSPDGTRVVTASEDGTARIWDVRTGQALTERLRHEDWVNSAQFSPDGTRVVTASDDHTARIWDARTGQALTESSRHKSLRSAQFSPDGTRLVTASWDRTARIWDARTGLALTEPLRHEDRVNSAQFSPDGALVVTASDDGTARIWDARTGQALTEPVRHASEVSSAQFSPDGTRVVTASRDETVRIWDARTGQVLAQLLGHENWVRSAGFSLDGTWVVTASDDRTARIWDARTGQALTEPLRHRSVVWSAHFSPDGTRVVTASDDRTARIWDARTGQALTEPLRHQSVVWSAHFSPDGTRVVTASDDRTARIWDARTGQPLSEPLPHEDWVNSAQFSPDGTRVVTASDDAARIWAAPVESVDLSHLLACCAYVSGWRAGRGVPAAALSAAEVEALSETVARLRQSPSPDPSVAWLVADRATRTISPYSKRTLLEHAALIAEIGTRFEVEIALGYVPIHPGLLMTLATLIVAEDGDRAVFLARLAAQQDPENAAVQKGYLGFLADLERYDATALAESSRLMERFPQDWEIAALRLRLLVGAQQWEGALDAITGLTQLVEGGVSLDLEGWRQILEDHTAVLRALGREQEVEGARVSWLSKRFAPRPVSAERDHLDLTAFYNAAWDDAWHNRDDQGNNLASLELVRNEDGLLELGGVTFDARGIVQLSRTAIRQFDSTGILKPTYPERVSNIPVEAPVQRVHFLHGLGWPEDDGVEIARYVLRYADGGEAEVPVVYGEQIRNWQFWPEGVAAEEGGAEPIWKGPQARWQEHWPDWGVRLYQLTWTNPRPEVSIQSFDFVSTMTKSAPFLIAVTVE